MQPDDTDEYDFHARVLDVLATMQETLRHLEHAVRADRARAEAEWELPPAQPSRVDVERMVREGGFN
jgi:hypothetical protein